MTTFCPEGYVPAREAIVKAALFFCADQIAALERVPASGSDTAPDNFADAVARAFARSQVLNILRREFKDIVKQTIQRLRNLLHQGKLKAYYFKTDGCHSVSRHLWATAHADDALMLGTISPFGQLFMMQSELDALLTKQPAKKRPFPRVKMSELVAALRKLENLPTRAAQLQALCDLSQFREFVITNAVFREAARQAGSRRAGRKSSRQS